MKPLAELDPRGVRYVLFDLDDTLTSAGRLTAEAYAALQSLQQGGKKLVPVTGRPAGWCDHIARTWPVDAIIGENGAFYFWFAHGKLHKRFVDDAQILYRDAARTQRWRDTPGQDVSGTANGAAQSLPVYARLPAGQTPPAGAYLDTVTAIVRY